MSRTIGRRMFIKAALAGTAAIPVAAQILRDAHAEDAFPMLDVNDATAKSLAYTLDTNKVDQKLNPKHKPDQKCSNCSQYLGEETDEKGGCNLFLAVLVPAIAWCNVWEAKPGK